MRGAKDEGWHEERSDGDCDRSNAINTTPVATRFARRSRNGRNKEPLFLSLGSNNPQVYTDIKKLIFKLQVRSGRGAKRRAEKARALKIDVQRRRVCAYRAARSEATMLHEQLFCDD